jgi:hypothetical protein
MKQLSVSILAALALICLPGAATGATAGAAAGTAGGTGPADAAQAPESTTKITSDEVESAVREIRNLPADQAQSIHDAIETCFRRGVVHIESGQALSALADAAKTCAEHFLADYPLNHATPSQRAVARDMMQACYASGADYTASGRKSQMSESGFTVDDAARKCAGPVGPAETDGTATVPNADADADADGE